VGIGEAIVVWLEIETWVIGKGGTKSGEGNGWWVGEDTWGLLGFVTLVCVWVALRCCREGWLCQGLQVFMFGT
jgi:hypothetical protein